MVRTTSAGGSHSSVQFFSTLRRFRAHSTAFATEHARGHLVLNNGLEAEPSSRMPGRIRALPVDLEIRMGPEVHSNALVVICGGHAEIEAAIHSLHSHRFEMKSVSVLGQEVPDDREVVGCYQISDICRYRGPLAAFWESLWEFLDGSGFFWMPALGWILVAGPLTRCVVASLDNASLFSGLNAVGSAMYSVGISLDDIVRYERSLKDGRLLLIVHGSVAIVEDAQRLFEQSR